MGRPGSSRGADYMRGFTWGVEGEEVVMKNLNKELEGIENRSIQGLIKAAAFIHRETETTPPKTPVDLGNLRSSWFTVTADREVAGTGEAKQWKGPKASIYAAEHQSTMQQGKAELKGMENMGKNKFLMLGYTANYAGFVHEMIEAKHWTREGSDWKWLETHIKRNTKKIVDIVKENATIKK